MDSWVALNIITLYYALGREFKPQWQQTLFQTQALHLCFLHDSIWFIWFDTIICLSNLSYELWNRKLKKTKFIFKKLNPFSKKTIWLNGRMGRTKLSCFIFISAKGTNNFSWVLVYLVTSEFRYPNPRWI